MGAPMAPMQTLRQFGNEPTEGRLARGVGGRGRTSPQLMTRDEETDLGRAVEQGDREVAEALLSSPVALGELGNYVVEKRQKVMRASRSLAWVTIPPPPLPVRATGWVTSSAESGSLLSRR
jgi:hypothetical protein